MNDISIPTRLRRYFREAATDIPARRIANYWEDEGFTPGSAVENGPSIRRNTWSAFESTVDWDDEDVVQRVIRVYECILPERGDPGFLSFVTALQRDGWDVTATGRIVPLALATQPLGMRIVADRYELDPAAIGRGGFGHVFLATVRSNGSDNGDRVAIKLMLPEALDNDEMVRRFQREIRTMSSLSHPHVLPILDSGHTEADGWWYTMPIAEGGSLSSYMKQNPGGLAPGETLEIMRMICSGVEAIHSANFLHRDLSPGNVLKMGDDWLVADFGLSVPVVRDTTVLTRTFFGGGTEAFFAPEQSSGMRDVTKAADIFSLGKLLQFMTTGQWPYSEPTLAHPLRRLIMKATNDDQATRHGSAVDLLAELQAAVVVPTGLPKTDADIQDEYLDILGARSLTTDERRSLVAWLGGMDERDYGPDLFFLNVLPKLHENDIRGAWQEDANGFAGLFEKFCYVALNFQSFGYEDVDAPGRFASRAAKLTGAPVIRSQAIHLLASLGRDKNRWLLRELALELVRGVKPGPLASAIVEGFTQAGPGASYWVMQDFRLDGLDSDTRNRLRAIMAPVLDRV